MNGFSEEKVKERNVVSGELEYFIRALHVMSKEKRFAIFEEPVGLCQQSCITYVQSRHVVICINADFKREEWEELI